MLDKMFTEAELASPKENGSGDIKPDFSLNYSMKYCQRRVHNVSAALETSSVISTK